MSEEHNNTNGGADSNVSILMVDSDSAADMRSISPMGQGHRGLSPIGKKIISPSRRLGALNPRSISAMGDYVSSTSPNDPLGADRRSPERLSIQKQRGFYSEFLSSSPDGSALKEFSAGPRKLNPLNRRGPAKKRTHTSLGLRTPGFGAPRSELVAHDSDENLNMAANDSSVDKYLPDSPLAAFEPKVLSAFEQEPGKAPRRIEIERRKRLFLAQDIEELLRQDGVDFNVMVPEEKRSYLPLAAFDDDTFDSRTTEEWLTLRMQHGENLGVPARALMRKDVHFAEEGTWDPCVMVDYDEQEDRFLVQWDADQRRELLPRIFICFASEDPFVFVKRIKSAIAARHYAESMLRYNVYIDHMPVDEIPPLSQQSVSNIITFATNYRKGGSDKSNPAQKASFKKIAHSSIMKEVNRDFARAMNRLVFDMHLKDPEQAGLIEALRLPANISAEQSVPDMAVVPLPMYDFDEAHGKFNFHTFLTKPSVISAIVKVRVENEKISSVSLYNIHLNKAVRVEEFLQFQTQAASNFLHTVKENWIPSLKNGIKFCLKDAGKGHFNIQEKSREIYDYSKLKKFMTMVNFMMEDSLRFQVEHFMLEYVTAVERLCATDVQVVSTNVVHSPDVDAAGQKRNPLFAVELRLHEGKFESSLDLQTFIDAPQSVFEKGLNSIAGIPSLEPQIMEELFWSHNPTVGVVSAQEPHALALKERLRRALTAAQGPLLEYIGSYAKFQEFAEMDVPTYIDAFEARNPDIKDVEKEIQKYLTLKEEIAQNIPVTINVGLFSVNCSRLSQQLAEKCNQVTTLLPQFLSRRSKELAKRISDHAKKIESELRKRPRNVEDVMGMREFFKTVPELLKEVKECIEEMVANYAVLEDFRYPLENAEFQGLWNGVATPMKIDKIMLDVEEQLKKDETRYKDSMYGEQDEFNRDLVGVSQVVETFHENTDPEKMEEIHSSVKRVELQLRQMEQKAKQFNSREVLFGVDQTEYTDLTNVVKAFEPYSNLWNTAAEWKVNYQAWTEGTFIELDAEQIEKDLTAAHRNMYRAGKVFKEKPDVCKIADSTRESVEKFKPIVPLIMALRNPGMRDRHWVSLEKEAGVSLKPTEETTLLSVMDVLKLDINAGVSSELRKLTESMEKISDVAGKEYSIEQALDKMEAEWETINLETAEYRDSGTFVLRAADEIQQVLDDHIVMTQAMAFSPYKKPFEERIAAWDAKLSLVSENIDEWLNCQRQWLYLEPIFSSDDINRQLPVEGKRFAGVDRTWRKILSAAHSKPHCMAFLGTNEKLLRDFQEANKLLDTVQKGLNDYLETKRAAFARFYFLSNDELLEILSQTKEPRAVQPHLRKCFEAIAKLVFEDDNEMTSMISAEDESVKFSSGVYPKGNVENWLQDVENMMCDSVKAALKESVKDYLTTPRTEWVINWPGQIVIAGSQIYWTKEHEESMMSDGAAGIKKEYERSLSQLEGLTELVRGELPKLARLTLGALITIDVHARDVTRNLVKIGTKDTNDFEWVSQMRYYWDNDADDCIVKMVQTTKVYGYEYLGNSSRLVITPLTDRIYMTLMGALHMNLGGAPAGPAGTGKTETTKDLAKALAKQCVVFNCSDGLDYLAMGKFFKGLASAGAWACFDEFNRIDIEVLSVIAQQITTIQQAIIQGLQRFLFEGSEIGLKPTCAVFITMNPGYAGRTELPDNLKALFRPVACMVPDYGMIAEIRLFSFGFSGASALSRKIVATFKLSSEQLSSQDHYDFGMRAVNTVIQAAGNLKKAEPTGNESVLVLRALKDSNNPKFLQQDITLFNGIISDLFPGTEMPTIDYGSLLGAIKAQSDKRNLVSSEAHILKCIQLFETTVVRHGLMLVGPTGGGKTTVHSTLAAAMSSLKGVDEFKKVRRHILNPKAITMGQLYGQFDEATHEWTDGIAAALVRYCSSDEKGDSHWMIFDGPVDAIWIENMNTVLDDNKKLCLVSGEIIQLTPRMNIIFEVEDLAVASPATVSRCGMVYVDPVALGTFPAYKKWLKAMPVCFEPLLEKLEEYFTATFDDLVYYLRKNMKEPVPTVPPNLVGSLTKLIYSFLAPFIPENTEDPLPDDQLEILQECVAHIFVFSLIWTVGCTTELSGRKKFDNKLRQTLSQQNVPVNIPEAGLVYDFVFLVEERKWKSWSNFAPSFEVDPKKPFAEIIVPTVDSIRYSFVISKLICCGYGVLVTGETGTGKTVTVAQLLERGLPEQYVPINMAFSARTSANQTQDMIDAKLEKRRKGVYGPPTGKKFVFFVDDLNMPARETYGAQPPIELLRQWVDHAGWFERKVVGTAQYRELVDIQFVAAMGPPGGGRNIVTNRFLRHFNMINFTEMEQESLFSIFSSILNAFLSNLDGDIVGVIPSVVKSTVSIFNTLCEKLLPTPTKSHYTFNLRDLSKVFGGILSADMKKIVALPNFLRLWIHENMRVFQDRLADDQDRQWFFELLQEILKEHFDKKWEDIVTSNILMFGDFLVPGADPKLYEEINDFGKLQKVMEEYLEDYNATSSSPLNLVMFLDAISHTARVSRIIRQPLGNALLLGVGGSGRQSLTKLATFMAEYKLFQIEISKGYGTVEWREDLKKVLRIAGIQGLPVVFLFTDSQIVKESFLEDINNILNSGDVPNMWTSDEIESIMQEMRPKVIALGIQPTKLALFSHFLQRVRKYIHVVLAMSPVGEDFRNRIRMFPSVVNCCTIDWFARWPDEALRNVANSALKDIELKGPDQMESVVNMCTMFHESVERHSLRFKEVLGRFNYVTPTSYLELLNTYKSLTAEKRLEVGTLKSRLETGLDKLLSTAEQVAVMQVELEDLQPVLIKTSGEVEEMMKQIAKDKESAAETKAEVEVEEKTASAKAAECAAIRDDAQRDLDEALPALEAAVQALKNLNRNDIVEVKAMQRPPAGVKLVMEAVCIMFKVKPKKVDNPAKVGSKIDDYWEPGKIILADPTKFIQNMLTFDRDNIAEKSIKDIEPYIQNEEFQPEAVAKVSKACTSMCLWVRAMHKYHYVAKAVEPKRQLLKSAEDELAVTMEKLETARARLAAVEAQIAELEANFEAAVAKKNELNQKVEECQARLQRAEKLIGGLGGEKVRWIETVKRLGESYENLVGDVLISAGTVSYLGAFTFDFRVAIVKEWQEKLQELSLPHTPGHSLFDTLGDPVKIRSWNISGLPADELSIQNGIIISKARRWPLCIDPQGQANKWIKNMEKDNNLDIIKLSEKDYLRTLENGVRFGKPVILENVAEVLESALEPVLLKQTFRQGGSEMIRLGDNVIPYHPDFRFYITTKLSNPHYRPEVAVKVTLLNFTITPEGLEEQLLGITVEKERPELAEMKSQLVTNNAAMKKQLKEIEDKIIHLLSNSTGNILDDEELINTLAAAKTTSTDISKKLEEAEVTEKEIDETRAKYRPVAFHAAILFFCISDLSTIDPMYQNSLTWFVALFVRGIADAEMSNDLQTRLQNLNDYFTYSLYQNICRSIFEAHKLLFSLLLCTRIMQGGGKLDLLEWNQLLNGPTGEIEGVKENPATDWLTEQSWLEIQGLKKLPAFRGFQGDFEKNTQDFRKYFETTECHLETIPAGWHDRLTDLERLLVLRALRPDKVIPSTQLFVASNMDPKYIDPPTFDLSVSYKEASNLIPLVFVLTAGADPAEDLFKFADMMRMRKKLISVSLGQGQGPIAERILKESMEKGSWVLLQNCHLAPSWMPSLERIVETLDPAAVHRDFRMWLTAMPSPKFPTAVLQNSVKMTNEPPKGLRANLVRSYAAYDDEFLSTSKKPEEWRRLLFSISLFHAIIQERRKFGPLGWNIPYEYTTGDMKISVKQLNLFLDEYDFVPYKVITQMTGHVNYGGRVTDDWDRRTLMTLLSDYVTPNIMDDSYAYSPSGIYSCPKSDNWKETMDYIRGLPQIPHPEIFGLHENADITCARNETFDLFAILSGLQPQTGAAGGQSVEDIIRDVASGIQERVPGPRDVEEVQKKYPTMYEESMNTVLVQEYIRYNNVLGVIQKSLKEILMALKGLVVMSQPLEELGRSLSTNVVPSMWSAKAYPSLKPLGAWVTDLVLRMEFLGDWYENNTPAVFWISGFYFPQAFLTGALQNYARKYVIPIDTISYDFLFQDIAYEDIKQKPEDGIYIRGLFFEGARWDYEEKALSESRPKELFTSCPVIHLSPAADREKPETGMYECPVYKVLTRAGTLSTTGHSTNYVIMVEVPSNLEQSHWIKEGVAMFCSLNY